MKTRAMVVVAALALAGGACGGGDDDSSDDAGAATEQTGDDADSGDDDSGSGSEWCDLARGVETESDLLEGIDFSDPEALEDAYQQLISRIEDAADSAPDEIQDDVELSLDRLAALFDALRDADFNIIDVDQALLEDPEAEAATERIEEYNERVCGIENDAEVTDDTGTGSGLEEGTIRDSIVAQFMAMGMTEEQAGCMVDHLDLAAYANGEAVDTNAIFDLFTTCEIDIADLQPGG